MSGNLLLFYQNWKISSLRAIIIIHFHSKYVQFLFYVGNVFVVKGTQHHSWTNISGDIQFGSKKYTPSVKTLIVLNVDSLKMWSRDSPQ